MASLPIANSRNGEYRALTLFGLERDEGSNSMTAKAILRAARKKDQKMSLNVQRIPPKERQIRNQNRNEPKSPKAPKSPAMESTVCWAKGRFTVSGSFGPEIEGSLTRPDVG